MDGLRLVLAFVLHVGMGAVPLWAVALSCPVGVAVDAGHLLGTGLGHVAALPRLSRMGAAAAPQRLRRRHRVHVSRAARECWFRVRVAGGSVHVCFHGALPFRSPLAPSGTGHHREQLLREHHGHQQLRRRPWEHHHQPGARDAGCGCRDAPRGSESHAADQRAARAGCAPDGRQAGSQRRDPECLSAEPPATERRSAVPDSAATAGIGPAQRDAGPFGAGACGRRDRPHPAG